MWQVNYSLIPVFLAALYFFGISALLVSAASVLGALVPEWVIRGSAGKNTLKDGSALITGLLLALTLPPGIPLWMAFLGGLVAVVAGKLIFGGIGYNVFNPALVGRVFLQATFPETMTTWTGFSNISDFFVLRGNNLAVPFLKTEVSAITGATPLAKMKFDNQGTELPDLLLGTTSGSMGETSAVVLLVCGLYLAMKGIINLRIPTAIFATVFLISALMFWIDPVKNPPPYFHLFSGGLILGAMFMATDPVTSPLTGKGCWIFGIGIGVLVLVIRLFGGLPEGVMYAILIMNGVSPLINRVTQPRLYGSGSTRLGK